MVHEKMRIVNNNGRHRGLAKGIFPPPQKKTYIGNGVRDINFFFNMHTLVIKLQYLLGKHTDPDPA